MISTRLPSRKQRREAAKQKGAHPFAPIANPNTVTIENSPIERDPIARPVLLGNVQKGTRCQVDGCQALAKHWAEYRDGKRMICDAHIKQDCGVEIVRRSPLQTVLAAIESYNRKAR
jgi:hypothetical protein